MSKIEIKHTGQSDDWSLPIYQDNKGINYVDVNIDDENPDPHHVTDWGEPMYPLADFEIVEKFSLKATS